jgi:uncharacterized protein (DUF4415 family)
MKKITKRQQKELARLQQLPDDEIDLSDAPEVKEWLGAVVGKFYRPIKRPITLRVDADVLDWWKRQGRGYQTRINTLLRQAMEGKRRTKDNSHPGGIRSGQRPDCFYSAATD